MHAQEIALEVPSQGACSATGEGGQHGWKKPERFSARQKTEVGVPAVLEQKTTIWCKYLYSLSLHPYESPMRRATRALSSRRVARVFQAARSDRRPWRFRA
jgi:hypothetical protein